MSSFHCKHCGWTIEITPYIDNVKDQIFSHERTHPENFKYLQEPEEITDTQ